MVIKYVFGRGIENGSNLSFILLSLVENETFPYLNLFLLNNPLFVVILWPK